MLRIINILILSAVFILSGCHHAKKDMEQQAFATCGDPHSAPSNQWQGCSFNRDCRQVCGTGWSCYSSDGNCHNH